MRRRPMSGAERALGLALSGSLRRSVSAEELGRRIAALGIDGTAVRLALAKVRRSLDERPSPIGERAERALVAALDLVAAPSAAAAG